MAVAKKLETAVAKVVMRSEVSNPVHKKVGGSQEDKVTRYIQCWQTT